MNFIYDFVSNNRIASVAALASLIATLMSLKSYRIAKEALDITKEQHLDRTKKLSLYLINLEKYRQNSDAWIYVDISISNNATLAKAIENCYLEVSYTNENLDINIVRLENIINPKITDNMSPNLSFPININALTATNGCIYFKIPTHLLQKVVKKYRLVLISSDKDEIYVESELWKEKSV